MGGEGGGEQPRQAAHCRILAETVIINLEVKAQKMFLGSNPEHTELI
jgi:hypothetical protein